MKPLLAVILLFCFSCGTDLNDQSEDRSKGNELSKSDMVGQEGKADSSIDYCAKFGWYGDGECDTFCPQADVQDCRSQSDLECANLCGTLRKSSCITSEECEETCQKAIGTWSDEQVDDFSACLMKPLCYQTVDQCMGTEADVSFCEEACSEQEENQFGWCGATECIQYCWENINVWDRSTEQAFLLCADENPLCYQTMENCVSARK